MAEKITVHLAKTNLSKLIARAEAGEEITIFRGDKPAAKLVPANDDGRAPRRPGFMEGRIGIDDAFFDPLPEDMMLGAPKRRRK